MASEATQAQQAARIRELQAALGAAQQRAAQLEHTNSQLQRALAARPPRAAATAAAANDDEDGVAAPSPAADTQRAAVPLLQTGASSSSSASSSSASSVVAAAAAAAATSSLGSLSSAPALPQQPAGENGDSAGVVTAPGPKISPAKPQQQQQHQQHQQRRRQQPPPSKRPENATIVDIPAAEPAQVDVALQPLRPLPDDAAQGSGGGGGGAGGGGKRQLVPEEAPSKPGNGSTKAAAPSPRLPRQGSSSGRRGSRGVTVSALAVEGTQLFAVSRAFPSWKRSILTEIYLCHACSYQEIEDGNARAGHDRRRLVEAFARSKHAACAAWGGGGGRRRR
eukprot:SAG25_NODE_165_length_13094_cov_31.386149_12_plen_337_part_00